MKAKKQFLLGTALLLGLGTVGVSYSPAAQANAADVDAKIKVVNRKVWNDQYGVVGLQIDPAINAGRWYDGPSATPSGTWPTMYDEYGKAEEMKSWFPYDDLLFTSYRDINRYGNILSIPSDFKLSSSVTGDTYSFEEQKWICKLADGDLGDWEPFVAPTSLSFSEDAIDLKIGQTLNISSYVDITTEDDTPVIVYQSGSDTTVTADNSGNITGVGVGQTKVTVHSGLLKDEITVNVAAASAQTGIKVTTPSDGILSTYVGVPVDFSTVKVSATYADGTEGIIPWDPATSITGEYDIEEAGEYPLTIKIGEFETTLTVKVDSVAKALNMDPSNVFGVTGTTTTWGMNFELVIDDNNQQNLNFSGRALDNALSHVLVNGSDEVFTRIKLLSNHFLLGTGSDFAGFKLGDTVTFKAGLYNWKYTGTVDSNSQEVNGDGEWIATAVLNEDLNFIYNGSAFLVAGVAVTDFSVAWDGGSVIMQGDTYHASVTFTPDTSAGLPVFESSDEDVLTVDAQGNVTGVAPGKATVTATLGEVKHTYDFTVTEVMEIKGIVPVNGYVHQVYVDQDLTDWAPTLQGFQFVYDDGSEDGITFPVVQPASGFTYSFNKEFDHSKAGETKTTVTVTYEEKTYTSEIAIGVYDLYDQVYETAGVVSWFNHWVFVDAPNTAGNKVNISNTKGTDWTTKYMAPHMHYNRADGTEVKLTTIYQLGHNTAIEPEFLKGATVTAENYNKAPYYQEGDIITIDAGMPIPKFTGGKIGAADPSNPDGMNEATGEIVVDGFTTTKTQFRFDGTTFVSYLPSDGIKATKESIEMTVGQNATAGVERTPEGATTGTITYESSDPSIATVTNAGIISAKAPGTCTITATITLDDGTTKSVTITVTVKGSSASESTPTTGETPTSGLTPAAIGGIVGGCIGGVVVIGLVVFLIIYFRKKKHA